MRFIEGHEAFEVFFAEDHHEECLHYLRYHEVTLLSRGSRDSGFNPLSFESHPGHHCRKNIVSNMVSVGDVGV